MSSESLYFILIGLVALERGVELVISRRNIRWALDHGGREYGAGHFGAMASLHTALLVGCASEVLVLGTPFVPTLGGMALTLVVLSQALRYWVIATLGRRWNVRVVVLPRAPAIVSGPYRWLRHPNYLAVVVEGLALPLVHGAWRTALIFSVLNAVLLTVRIRCEESALASESEYHQDFSGRARLFPGV